MILASYYFRKLKLTNILFIAAILDITSPPFWTFLFMNDHSKHNLTSLMILIMMSISLN